MYNRHEMLDVVMIDGVARGIIARNLLTVNMNVILDMSVVLSNWRLWQCFLPIYKCNGKQRNSCLESSQREQCLGILVLRRYILPVFLYQETSVKINSDV